MPARKRILFFVGGPEFHPVAEQAQAVTHWLEGACETEIIDGNEAFDHLDRFDLFVGMALTWSGWQEEGETLHTPLNEEQKEAFERFVRAGRPVLAFHGGIASFDEWPRYGELLGFTWVWGTTNHSPVQDHRVHLLPTRHPIVNGLRDYTIHDELYYDVKLTPGLDVQVHAEAPWDGAARPMIMTAVGGRVAGAGKTAYLANGHDMKAFECPAMPQLWRNTINWLLDREEA